MNEITEYNIPRLPSQDAAIHLVTGASNGLIETIGCTLFRAALISAGLYAAGYRDDKLFKASLYGATSVEIFVLGYTAYHVRKQSNVNTNIKGIR